MSPLYAGRVTSDRMRAPGSIERLALPCLVVAAVLMAIQLGTLTRFPEIHPDEPWFSNAAWNWLTTGVNFDTMHAGVLDQFGYAWVRRSFLGELPWLVSFATLGLGFFQARFASWLLGVAVLVATWRIGDRLHGRPTGALAALLLAAAPPFIQASHQARQEIWLVLFGLGVFALGRRALARDASWMHLAAGALAGVSTEIHQNGLLYVTGLIGLYTVHHGRALLGQRGTWLCAAGGLAGLAVFVSIHILPSPETYLKLHSFVLENSHGPPILEGPAALVRGLFVELLRYKFNVDGLPLIVIGASFALLFWRGDPADRQLLAFTGGILLAFWLAVGSNSPRYRILSFPFLLLGVAEAFSLLLREAREQLGRTPQAVFLPVLFALFVAYYPAMLLYDTAKAYRYEYDYDATSARIAALIPDPEARVMGLPTWWLGLHAFEFRSSFGLAYAMWYDGCSLTECLEAMAPDVVIVDDHWREHLYDELGARDGTPRDKWHVPGREFERYLDERGTLLGSVSDPVHGRIDVYAITAPGTHPADRGEDRGDPVPGSGELGEDVLSEGHEVLGGVALAERGKHDDQTPHTHFGVTLHVAEVRRVRNPHGRHLDLGRVPADFGAGCLELAQVGRELIGAHGRREPAVAVARRAFEGLALRAADHDRERVLYGDGLALEAGPVEELALVLDDVSGPDLPHRLDVVVEARTTTLEGRSRRLELLAEPPDTDAELEAPTRDEVETGRLLRDVERVRLRKDVHAGSEPDRLRLRGDRGERDQGVDEVGVRVDAHLSVTAVRVLRLIVDRNDGVLERPDGLEADALRDLRHRDHGLAVRDADVDGNEADLHEEAPGFGDVSSERREGAWPSGWLPVSLGEVA